MVYKKYIKKRGKTFGPYYYKSYRDGNKIRKIYIGKEWSKSSGNSSEDFEKRDLKKNLRFVINKNSFSGTKFSKFFFVFLILIFLFFVGNSYHFFKGFGYEKKVFTGLVVSENGSENFSGMLYVSIENESSVLEIGSVDSNLSIKEPVKIGDEVLSENKNKRMEFDLKGEKVRLYFDLLNYSEFVENVVDVIYKNESSVIESTSEVNLAENETLGAREEEKNITLRPREENETLRPSEEEKNITLDARGEEKNITEKEVSKNETISEGAHSGKGKSKEEKERGNEVAQSKREQAVQTSKEDAQGKSTEKSEEKTITGNIIKFFKLTGKIVGRVISGVVRDENESSSNITSLNSINSSNDSVPLNENLKSNSETNISNESLNERENKEALNNESEKKSLENQESSSEKLEISKEIELNEIKNVLENLSEDVVENITKSSVISSENFDIKINSTKPKEYKWGYKVKLKDLKFMAKIDVTSNETISKYNNYTLRIGKRNLLSFEDLVKQGYKVRIELPPLEIPINITINETKIIVSENITQKNITQIPEQNLTLEKQNITEVNKTFSVPENETLKSENKTFEQRNESSKKLENETSAEAGNETLGALEEEKNITLGALEEEKNITLGALEEEKNITEKEVSKNETISEVAQNGESAQTEVKSSDETVQPKKEEAMQNRENTQPSKEGAQSGEATQPKKEEAVQPKKEEAEVNKEGAQEKGTEKSEETTITGNIIKFFKLTGKIAGFVINSISGKVVDNILGIQNITIEDIKYSNTITVYIEKDFSDISENPVFNSNINFEDLDKDGKISIGDVIELDPYLIIEISKAEHLDENRTFIEDVYDYVKTKDNNWIEIPQGHYIRVTFEKNLTKNNDITLFARNLKNESSEISVFRENSDEEIARFTNIKEEKWYKIYLTNLTENESRDVFDLKVSGNNVEIDYIIDPNPPSSIWNKSDVYGVSYAIDVDNNEGVYVAGIDNSDTTPVGRTIKYNSSDSNTIWSQAANNYQASLFGVDYYQNFVYAAGDYPGVDSDGYIVKHNSTNGSIVWDYIYQSGDLIDDVFYDIAVNNEGIYVVGYHDDQNFYPIDKDFIIIRFNHDYTINWSTTYNGSLDDVARGVSLDSSGNIYVTGKSDNKFRTLKYDSSGNLQWNVTGPNGTAYGIALDSLGNVYVTGNSNGNYTTLKYDSSGNLQWNVTGPNGTAYGIALDSSGNVYVTGNSNGNYTTLKYNSTGNLQWTLKGPSGTAYGIALDSQNYIYITGESGGFYTIKYNNVSTENNAPKITYVSPISAVDPTEATYKSVTFYITAYDEDGVADLNDSSFRAEFNNSNEPRRSGSCTLVNDIDTKSANYSCTVNMWYWDKSGVWTINASGTDNYGAYAENFSTTFTYNQLKAIVIYPETIYWKNVIMNSKNQTADNSTIINNTGNYNATGKIAINAINLIKDNYFIDVKNFTVDIDSGTNSCDGIILENNTDKTITQSVLDRGNLSEPGTNSIEELFYCIPNAPTNLPSGIYDTSIGGSWIIKMV